MGPDCVRNRHGMMVLGCRVLWSTPWSEPARRSPVCEAQTTPQCMHEDYRTSLKRPIALSTLPRDAVTALSTSVFAPDVSRAHRVMDFWFSRSGSCRRPNVCDIASSKGGWRVGHPLLLVFSCFLRHGVIVVTRSTPSRSAGASTATSQDLNHAARGFAMSSARPFSQTASDRFPVVALAHRSDRFR